MLEVLGGAVARCGGQYVIVTTVLRKEVLKWSMTSNCISSWGKCSQTSASVALARIGDALVLYKTLHERGPVRASTSGKNLRREALMLLKGEWILLTLLLTAPMSSAAANVVTDWDTKAVGIVQAGTAPPPPLAGCGKSRDFEKMAMERARYRIEGHIRSMAYGRAPGDEWQRNDDQSTFSAAC